MGKARLRYLQLQALVSTLTELLEDRVSSADTQTPEVMPLPFPLTLTCAHSHSSSPVTCFLAVLVRLIHASYPHGLEDVPCAFACMDEACIILSLALRPC